MLKLRSLWAHFNCSSSYQIAVLNNPVSVIKMLNKDARQLCEKRCKNYNVSKVVNVGNNEFQEQLRIEREERERRRAEAEVKRKEYRKQLTQSEDHDDQSPLSPKILTSPLVSKVGNQRISIDASQYTGILEVLCWKLRLVKVIVGSVAERVKAPFLRRI